MRRFAAALTIAAAPLAAVGAAGAQTGGASQDTTAPSSEVTVRAPERMVCRQVTRTATRMRSNRVCRTVTQWEEARASRTQDDELADAADTLETFGEKVSTNDIGGLGGREHDTPLGPR